MNSGIYDRFADYYDIFSSGCDFGQWYQYLRKISGLNELRQKHILDLGCGTGELLLRFARAGAFVYGIDISAQMLSHADQKFFHEGFHGRFVHADICAFTDNRKYDFIYSACDSINYLRPEALGDFLMRASSLLQRGAVLTFDILNKEYFAVKQNLREQGNAHGAKWKIERILEKDRLISEVHLTSKQTSFSETHIQYFHEPDSLIRMAKNCGFGKEAVYHFLTFDLPDTACDKFQLSFIKE